MFEALNHGLTPNIHKKFVEAIEGRQAIGVSPSMDVKDFANPLHVRRVQNELARLQRGLQSYVKMEEKRLQSVKLCGKCDDHVPGLNVCHS